MIKINTLRSARRCRLCALDARSLREVRGPQAPPPPQVSVAQVLEKRVKDWDEFTGRLQAARRLKSGRASPATSTRSPSPKAARSSAATLLFVIDPRPYQAEYDRAAADVKRYKTALELGQIELTRVQQLKDSGAVSQEELDERKSTVAQAEANVAGAQAALESAALNLNFTRVTSPIDGRVSRAEVTRGNLVTGGSNGGTLLSSVVSMDPIYLYFDADEQSYLRYTQMAKQRRASEFARLRQPGQRGSRQRRGVSARRHGGFRRQSTESADRHHSRPRRAAEQGWVSSRRACLPACSCSAAANIRRF